MDIRDISSSSFPIVDPSGWKGFDCLANQTKTKICEMIQARGDIDSLHSLASASKEFHTIVTGLFRQTITLEPTDTSIRHLRNTIDMPELARRYQRIVIKSVPTGFDELGVWPHRFPGRHGGEHTEDWEAAIADLHRLPALDSVVLTFTTLCADERDDPDEEQPIQHICEPPEVRNRILAVVFDAMAAINEMPGRAIHSLTVVNLQNKIHDAASSPAFTAVVSRLRELRVEVITEVVPRLNLLPGEEDDEEEYWDLDLQIKLDFWTGFNRFWLSPAQGTLEVLAVSCSDPFGVVPRWDLSELHFPSLRHLELEKVTFSYKSQVEWIAAHKTLQTLWLHNCPIAQQWRTRGGTYEGELDLAALVKHTSQPQTLFDTWVSELRWSDVVLDLCRGLLELREFEMTWSEDDEQLPISRKIVQNLPRVDELPLYHTFKGIRRNHWSVLCSLVKSKTCMPPLLRSMTTQRSLDIGAFEHVQDMLQRRIEDDEMNEIGKRFVNFVQSGHEHPKHAKRG